jgi:AraC-like DNA-binding protein
MTNFLNDLRLDQAASWLHSGPEPAESIGRRCGMANVPHFYRCFQKRFGLPPGKFRHMRHDAQLGLNTREKTGRAIVLA